MHILHVVGARPNFMKAAPVLRALSSHSDIRQTLIHTGQHYDTAMSAVFFDQLEMPRPDCNLEIGSATHAQQTARIMMSFEPVLLERKPDLVLVYGDVNSTVAAALVCSKLGVPVAHIEAGLRSGDRNMPEEINRILTDQLSRFLFTPSADGDANLLREGIPSGKIHLVGNVMIDSLVRLLPKVQEHASVDVSSPYALVTLHRPSNVDDLPWLQALVATLMELSQKLNVIFPVHPRTRLRLHSLPTAFADTARLRLLEPLPYLEFLALQQQASLVITDSGGIQEESTFLGVPCLTVRENTERPITIQQGTNQLVGRDLTRLKTAADKIVAVRGARTHVVPRSIPLWDGHAAERIAQIIVRWPAGS
jgi:UDP-N-acetylglucosamine 2-epimerase (non-hydrolysing)